MRSAIKWENYGNAISDNSGELRDIDEIIAELKEIQQNYSTHSMNDHVLWLRGGADMLDEIIAYLERV